MIAYLYVRFPGEAAWIAARDAMVTAGTVFVADVLGAVWHQGATELDPPIAQPGWCVNLVIDGIDAVPTVLAGALVNPVVPKRVFCGIAENERPTVMEQGDTLLVAAPIGQPIDEGRLSAAELALARRKLAAETQEDRRALHQANIILAAARARAQQAVQARNAATAAVLAADAVRDALVAQRDVQQAIRTNAIEQLAGLTGAARLPVVAVRDAAVAELARIVPLLTEANAAIAVTRDARDAAVTALVAEKAQVVSLRAARDALLI
jgi:hypothetical protein